MAASRTDSARAPSLDSGTHDLIADSMAIGWAVFTSPLTLMALLGLLAGVLGFGAVVGQGATEVELLGRREFAEVAALQAFGLDHVAASWLAWLLLLLIVLNGAGLWLRHDFLQPPSLRFRDSWLGPAVSRAAVTVSRPLADVEATVREVVGGAQRVDPVNGLRARRGLWTEGATLVVLGLAALLGAALISSAYGLDGRIELLPGDAGVDIEGNPIPPVTRVHTGGTWLEQALPIGIHCDPADPADPQRRRMCVVGDGESTTQIMVGAGRTVDALGYAIQPVSERPLASRGQPTVLLRKPGAPAPEVLRGEHGRTYQLPEGVRLTTWTGPDGPLVVVRPPEGAKERARLLAPAEVPGAPPGLAADRTVSAVASWQLTLAVRADPARNLVFAGLGVLLLGLAALAIPAQLTVVARSLPDGATEVLVWSFNRRGLAASTAAAVEAACRRGAGVPALEAQ